MTDPFLLQVNSPAYWPYIVPFVSSTLSLLVGWLLARSKRKGDETAEQKKARLAAERDKEARNEERIKKIELDNANLQERMTGMHVQFERQNDANDQRFRTMETQLGEVGRLREDMVGMKSEMRHMQEGQNKLEARFERQESKMDRILELLRSAK